MHFLMRARALVVFPGCFGTLDELFDAITLIQTRKIKSIPVILFGKEFWQQVIRFDIMVEEGTISHEDMDLFRYVETAAEAWDFLSRTKDFNQPSEEPRPQVGAFFCAFLRKAEKSRTCLGTHAPKLK